jgi:inhibitor of KinA sporulation pathway (predicted exonuclease)
MDQSTLSIQELEVIEDFLSKISETNEDTEYRPSEEHIVDLIITMVKDLNKTSITEDFEIAFVHPMVTVQKWCEELKIITRQEIQRITG